MQTSRRTFLKAAAVSAGVGGRWNGRVQAQNVVEVRVHFAGLFLALKHGQTPFIASVDDESGHHPAHSVMLAIATGNYDSGGIGSLACASNLVRAYRITNGVLMGPRADQAVTLNPPSTSGRCPANANEWRDPRWHAKLSRIGRSEKADWHAQSTVDVKMKVEEGAVEAEPPFLPSARKLIWKVGNATQALTDRLLYVVKTRTPEFKLKSGTLKLKGPGPIHVYVLTVPVTHVLQRDYAKGDTLPHFSLGDSLLQSPAPVPEAIDGCNDAAPSVAVPDVVNELYDCLFPMFAERSRQFLATAPKDLPGGIAFKLSKTVFCPGFGSYP